MAEAMFRKMVKEKGLQDQIEIDSAATSTEEIGNPMYPPAVRMLQKEGVPVGCHRARQLTARDYDRFDLLIGMDDANIRNMTRICRGDPSGKIHKLLEYAGEHGSIADPWYTDDFETCYRDLSRSLSPLLDSLSR